MRELGGAIHPSTKVEGTLAPNDVEEAAFLVRDGVRQDAHAGRIQELERALASVRQEVAARGRRIRELEVGAKPRVVVERVSQREAALMREVAALRAEVAKGADARRVAESTAEAPVFDVALRVRVVVDEGNWHVEGYANVTVRVAGVQGEFVWSVDPVVQRVSCEEPWSVVLEAADEVLVEVRQELRVRGVPPERVRLASVERSMPQQEEDEVEREALMSQADGAARASAAESLGALARRAGVVRARKRAVKGDGFVMVDAATQEQLPAHHADSYGRGSG